MSRTDAAGKAFMAGKEKEPGYVKTKSGLIYKVLEKGTGTKSPKVGTPCLCHYRGTFINGKEFDSSLGGEPLEFAPNQVGVVVCSRMTLSFHQEVFVGHRWLD